MALALLLTRGVGAQPVPPSAADSASTEPRAVDTVVTAAPTRPAVLLPVPPPASAGASARDSAGIEPRVVAPFAPVRPVRAPLDRSSWISWTPRVSRLAIPRFAAGDSPFSEAEGWQLRYPLDARTVQLSVDSERGVVRTALTAADVAIGEAHEIPLEDYARELTSINLRRKWVTESMARINHRPAALDAVGKTGPLTFRLPIGTMPKIAQTFLGKGGPTLNVSGSERISISGTSQWDNSTSGSGVRRSLFPQLDMRQDLNIALNGSLGDKVHVDVAQNSANTLPLANRIGIRYGGYEDEILKTLDLGNTNLELPGTQYVSYSGRNEGLFGVKAAARVGGTDISVIASKQEGRSERKSFQGTAQEVIRQIDDLNYIKGKYFFLQRPADQLATGTTIDISTLKVFRDDKNGTNDQGVRVGFAEINPDTAASTSARIQGSFDGLLPLTDYEVTTFYYGERFPVLVLKNSMSSSEILGVTYDEISAGGQRRTVGFVPPCPADPDAPCDTIRVKIIQAPRDELKARADAPDLYETDLTLAPFNITRDYEIKSFYDLQTSNINAASLQLQVRRYDANLEVATDAFKDGVELFTYLQIMGIDLFSDAGGGAVREGSDQLVDQFTNATFLDLQRGILFFPDLRPFDPRLPGRPDATPEEEFFFKPRIANTDQSIPGLRKRVLWPAGASNPPGVTSSPITPDQLETNPNVYDKRNIQPQTDREYYIYAKFSGQDYSGQIYLGQTNLLEGSDVVAIDGIPLERNKDYSIDYEGGTVTLLTARAREGRARMTIDYSFAPLFAQAGRTLVGSAIGYRGIDRSFGGAFIYESRGQQEARPRLGEEPSRTFIGDVSTQFSLKPRFLTDLVDKLPFYSTTEESRIDINGEIGYSRPNPNTKNTVYLDDFEGNRDSYSAPMSRGFWKWAAPPLVVENALTDTVKADNAELIWYNPYNTVKAGDLNPRLTKSEGNQNIISALDFYIPRAPEIRDHPGMWAGITTTVEPDGADFSRLQYLELWVNDWRDEDVRSNPGLKLHVDLGVMSEDQQRAPNAPPNGLFDTEDKNKDGKYDPRGPDSTLWEDGGADGIVDGMERERYDLSTSNPGDLHGDNYDKARNEQGEEISFSDNSNTTVRVNPFVYILPTLTEASKNTAENVSRVYTEDLNNNQLLETTNSYVSYILPIGDQLALRRFVIAEAESTTSTDGGTPVAPNNGWRRYRIPLDESDPAVRQIVGAGSLSNVKHMRVWLEGITTFKGNDTPAKTNADLPGRQPLIEIAAIDVVGNRWRIATQDSVVRAANGSVVARNVNNQEDRNVYTPPFEVETQSRGASTQTQREQSLALEVTRLPLGSTAIIFKTETQPEDYTRYGRLGFYTALFGFSDQDSARYFVRLGYDDRNYYEYSRPIRGAASAPFRPTPWSSVIVDLTDFTDVKFDRPSSAVSDTVDRGDERFVVVGSPTFTRVQQFSLGIYSERSLPDSSISYRVANAMSGTIWIDDLRALDVDRSPGIANRLTVYTKIADLLTLTTNYDKTDENFQRLGQLRGSDITSGRFSLSGSFAPHRFFASSGIQIPVSFNYNKSTSTPRLFTGTDIVLGREDRLNERTTGVDRGFAVSFSKTGDRNPILRNTLGRLSLSYTFTDRVGQSPTSIDSSRTRSGGISYSLAPSEWLKIPLPLLKTRSGPQKLLILPTTASISYSQSTQRSFLYKRDLGDAVGDYSLQNDIYRKTALYQLSASWRPLPFGTYSITSTRNAYIPTLEPARLLGLNIGRQTNFTQRIDGRFGFKLTKFFNPNFDFSSSYSDLRTPDLSPNLKLGQFQNSSNGGVSFEIPFARFVGAPKPPPARLAVTDTSRRDSTAIVRPRGRGFSLPVGRVLARLGTVSVRGTFSRTTGLSRYFGSPSIPYRLGLVRSPDTQWNGEEVQSVFRGPQATDNAQRTYSGDASTQISLIGRSNMRVRTTYTNTNRVYNSQVSNSANLTFPDLDVDWGSVEKVMRLGRVFPQLGARSRFTRTDTREGLDLANPTSKTRSQNFSPLFSLQGTSKGQAVVQLSVDRTSSLREDFSTRRATRKEGSTTVRTSISRTYLPGQKVPILGGKGLKSSLTLQADGAFNKRTGSTQAFGGASSKTNNDRIDLNSSGTYAFSSYVNGTIGLGFTQSRDLQLRNVDGKPRKQRSIRLEAAATFRF